MHIYIIYISNIRHLFNTLLSTTYLIKHLYILIHIINIIHLIKYLKLISFNKLLINSTLKNTKEKILIEI